MVASRLIAARYALGDSPARRNSGAEHGNRLRAPNGYALNGFNEVGYLFHDLPAAQAFCQSQVDQTPSWGALFTMSVGSLFTRLSASNTSSGALVWLDARHDWMLLLGFLVGAPRGRRCCQNYFDLAEFAKEWQRLALAAIMY